MIINDLSLFENSIVIAPREVHDSFLSHKSENPYLDFSLMDINDLVSLFSYQYDDRAIEEIMRKGFFYEQAKKMLELFSSVEADIVLNEEEKEIRDELIKYHLLYQNAYQNRTFINKTVLVYAYKYKDIIDHYISNIPGVKITYLEPEKVENPCKNLFSFKDIYEEVHCLFNSIAEDLSSGTDINNIYVVGASSDYDILFDEFSRHYGFEIENGNPIDLYHSQTFKRFLTLCEDKKPTEVFDVLVEEGYPIKDIESLERIVLRWNGVTGEEELDTLIYRAVALSKRAYKPAKENIVRRLNSFVAPEGSHLYLVNFSMGTFPPVYEEDSYISDNMCDKVHLISSVEKTKETKRQLIDLLNTSNVKYISFTSSAFGTTLFESSLVSTLGLNVIKSPISEVEYADDKGLIAVSTMKDKYDNYLIVDKRLRNWEKNVDTSSFKKYDYKFKAFPIDTSTLKRRYSASSLKKYFQCPFAYYLSYILGISTYETNFPALIGDVFHDYLSKYYSDGYFDETISWEDSIEKVSKDKDYEFTEMERTILGIVHEYAMKAVSFVRSHEQDLESLNVKTEEGFSVPIEEGSPITIKGFYDKLVTFGPDGKYYTIIDYKTGSERFNQVLFQYGLSIQLPLYALYAKNEEKLEGKELMGLFIAPLLSMKVFHSNMNKTYEEEVLSSFKWDGVFLAEPNKIKVLSPNNPSDMIVGLSFNKDGNFIDRAKNPDFSRIKSSEKLDEMSNRAKDLIIQADGEIIKGNFEIKPIDVDGLYNSCDMCEYRSICFRKDEAVIKKPKIVEDEGNVPSDNEEEEVPYGVD